MDTKLENCIKLYIPISSLKQIAAAKTLISKLERDYQGFTIYAARGYWRPWTEKIEIIEIYVKNPVDANPALHALIRYGRDAGESCIFYTFNGTGRVYTLENGW